MTAAPVALLDSCVLVNFSLCDTLLRMAEPPQLYGPRWSEEILAETLRTWSRSWGGRRRSRHILSMSSVHTLLMPGLRDTSR